MGMAIGKFGKWNTEKYDLENEKFRNNTFPNIMVFLDFAIGFWDFFKCCFIVLWLATADDRGPAATPTVWAIDIM